MNRLLARTAASTIGLAALTVPLLSCTSLTTSQTCIDWVFFDAPADAASEADAVARGHIADQAGTTSYMDIPATTWNVEVDDWLEGDGDAEIVVTSLPRSCGDTTDAMAEMQDEDELVFFLRKRATGWEIITPWQGVTPATPDGGIPETWPEEQAG
ncbi:hypothetical protein [Microbacterium oxydans]|uniref:hypothetical protein n=1 Tax=Microbacterium oxydans TaxID=82380 RepID=UPI00226B25CB|nr:hypothetical protein [Microbacterium oxydans]WAA66719.1 hypothetical protein MME74_02935 [Microbacterium oxydans]